MGVEVQRNGMHEEVECVKDWRVDVSVEERSVTKMVGNREWDYLHAEDTRHRNSKPDYYNNYYIPTCCSQCRANYRRECDHNSGGYEWRWREEDCFTRNKYQ